MPTGSRQAAALAASKSGRKNRTVHAEALRQLGARVREVRRRKHLTQEVLAERMGVSVAYLSLIERGGRNPPYTTVAQLARALSVPLEQLF